MLSATRDAVWTEHVADDEQDVGPAPPQVPSTCPSPARQYRACSRAL